MRSFRFIDLFCGLGGFHIAMRQLGGECVFASDIDDSVRDIYAINHGIRPHGDITKIDERDIPPHDVICAGFPCQAFSIAGKREGFLDKTRGTLFFDVIRIANYHKPKFMLLENVKNLKTHDGGKTWEVIYNSIKSLGYNLLPKPIVISPHHIGIPHYRERVYIMCVREDIGSIPIFKLKHKPKNTCIESILQEETEVPDKYRLNKNLVDLLSVWEDFYKGVDKVCSEVFYEYLNEDEVKKDTKGFKSQNITSNYKLYRKNKSFIDLWKKYAMEKSEIFREYKSRRNAQFFLDKEIKEDLKSKIVCIRQSGVRFSTNMYSPTLTTISSNVPIVYSRLRRLTPREYARLQSFPDSFIIDPNDRNAYKQFGNSVNVEVVKLVAKYMFGDKQVRDRYAEQDLFS